MQTHQDLRFKDDCWVSVESDSSCPVTTSRSSVIFPYFSRTEKVRAKHAQTQSNQQHMQLHDCESKMVEYENNRLQRREKRRNFRVLAIGRARE